MALMKSFTKCDPSRNYTWKEIATMAIAQDMDFLRDIIKNGTEGSKEVLVDIAKIMESNWDDGMSDHGAFILEDLGYDRCPGCAQFVPKEYIEIKKESNDGKDN